MTCGIAPFRLPPLPCLPQNHNLSWRELSPVQAHHLAVERHHRLEPSECHCQVLCCRRPSLADIVEPPNQTTPHLVIRYNCYVPGQSKIVVTLTIGGDCGNMQVRFFWYKTQGSNLEGGMKPGGQSIFGRGMTAPSWTTYNGHFYDAYINSLTFYIQVHSLLPQSTHTSTLHACTASQWYLLVPCGGHRCRRLLMALSLSRQ